MVGLWIYPEGGFKNHISHWLNANILYAHHLGALKWHTPNWPRLSIVQSLYLLILLFSYGYSFYHLQPVAKYEVILTHEPSHSRSFKYHWKFFWWTLTFGKPFKRSFVVFDCQPPSLIQSSLLIYWANILPCRYKATESSKTLTWVFPRLKGCLFLKALTASAVIFRLT